MDGSAKSHELFLAYDRFSLSELEPPMLLQEFVNHGMPWLLICEPYYCNNILSFYFVVWLNCFTCPTVGGVLFKIYIIGETIKVVRRFSLPNVSKRELAKVVGVFRFPRVSSAAASADDADLDPGIAGEVVDPVSVCVPQNIYLQPSRVIMAFLLQNFLPALCWKGLQGNSAVGW